jgi:iron complex transport system substrate-binding protein
VFREIEQKYQQLMTLTESAADKPPVFSGILYGDTWFAPGGNSFVARFIEDAGGYYTWGDQKIAGSVELSFEAVLDRNVKTNFWIGAGGFLSKHAIEDSDPRYANFHAFKTGDIYNYHGRIGATGGFEYLELGGARPDLVLADFMKILHPELLPNYQFYFFKKLH